MGAAGRDFLSGFEGGLRMTREAIANPQRPRSDMKKKHITRLGISLTACAALTLPVLNAAEAAPPQADKAVSQIFGGKEVTKPLETGSARYIPGEERSVLQTPCYRFTDAQGRKIELTGVIHVGEKEFYEGLNRHLEGFDAVLFEMVADPESIAQLRTHPPGRRDGDKPKEEPLGKLYRILAHDLLNLSLQVEVIDYRRPNFVHADLGSKELQALLAERGLTEDTLLAGPLAAMGLKLEQIATLLPMMKLLVPKDDPQALERMFAPTMVNLESMGEGGKNPAFEEIVIGKRNERVMKVLDEQLAAGKRNLSIFYGSGHFEDLRQRLKAKGWTEAGVDWRDAWVISGKAPAAAADGAKEAKPQAAGAAADPAATEFLSTAFTPFAKAPALGFTAKTKVELDLMGQKETQGATTEVKAMRPNRLWVRNKNMEGIGGTLTCDGITVTLHADGAATYKQFPAPATFAGFAQIPGLSEIGLEDPSELIGFLSLDPAAFETSTGIHPTGLLEAADHEGKSHARVAALMTENPVTLWVDKERPFPLSKLEIDPSKLLDAQLAELGEQAAAIKSMVKIQANITFTDVSTGETLPEETFRFVPPADAQKE